MADVPPSRPPRPGPDPGPEIEVIVSKVRDVLREELGPPGVAPPTRAGGQEFRNALTQLASDADYRARATEQPELVLRDFSLSLKELQALRQIALLSGADISAVNRIRASEITKEIGGVAEVNVDVSCCSCCCCC